MCRNILCACLLLVCVFGLAADLPAAPSLHSWTLHFNGGIYYQSFPPSADSGEFDLNSGLGRIRLTHAPGTAGNYTLNAFFDHEFSETINGFSNEIGAVTGTPAAEQSWEIDEPDYVSGDIYSHVVASPPLNPPLDNTNSVAAGNNNDVALALAWDYALAAHEKAVLTLHLTETPPENGIFYLRHTDTHSGDSVYFYGLLETLTTGYQLTTSANNGAWGQVDPAGSNWYAENAQVTLTATASPGYYFVEWSGDLTGSTSPATITMDGDKSVLATFAAVSPEQVSLTTAADPTGGGAITPEGTTWYDLGTEVTVTAQANAGYGFSHWSGNLSGSSNPTALVLDGKKSVTAHFTGLSGMHTVTVTCSPDKGGRVEPSGTHQYATGTALTITAAPAPGWRFIGWAGDATGSANPMTVTVTGPLTIEARFESPAGEPAPVPAITDWGLLALTALLSVAAVCYIRRRGAKVGK